MSEKAKKSGFTLVELIVAMISASILILAATVMLWQSQRAVTRLNGIIGIHRDMRASLDVLTRVARAGTGGTFSAGSVYTIMYTSKAPSRVYAISNSLYYMPSTAQTNNFMRLANGTVSLFDVNPSNTNLVFITLVLSSPIETMSNRIVVARRNK